MLRIKHLLLALWVVFFLQPQRCFVNILLGAGTESK